METIRLFLHSNNFFNNRIKTDEIISRENSSNDEKVSRDNIKTFLSSHSSSSSLSSRYPLNSSELERCSGSSIPNLLNKNETNIVASASASISNAHSFTLNDYFNNKNRKRRYSWTGEHNIHHIHSLSSSIRRTKSFRYHDRTRKHFKLHKYQNEKIIQVNRSTKSFSFPISNNSNNQSISIPSTQISSVKTTTTNAFLTAASLFKYWVHLFLI